MFKIVLFIIGMLIFQQPYNQTSVSAEQKTDGLYYLVFAGDQSVINKACGFGNCGRGFVTRIDALNYWTGSLLGPSLGLNIAPIPVQVAAAEPPDALRCVGDPECMASVMYRYQGGGA